ncbi:MAG: PEGA domain-containing protein [Verrucomicrobia bacterium]|nr:PEGA domain-containing protein [Kiritimatiellia bacterium]MCB1101363.1 PEGA domain-containing protein [Kiritimatiellia bacterium]MCP5489305.1 PEGA domain-containing protein [Verrucomicrobiota bacterium]
MKTGLISLLTAAVVYTAGAAPLRVAVLDFEDRTGDSPDARLGGKIDKEALADRGAYLLGKELLGQGDWTLIDRRDFIAQIEAGRGPYDDKKPSFLRAAQMVNADAVLRGTLMSFSTSRSSVNQGGYKTDLLDLTVRVSVEALDVRDGAILAVVDGKATERFRQTEQMETELGDEDVLALMEKALKPAVSELHATLQQREEALQNRPKVQLTVTSPDGPAMVEIDGVLVGTTPLETMHLYAGDHVLTVGRPGYRDVVKRILIEQDMAIDVPLLKNELDADQIQSVLESSRLNIYQGLEPALLIETIQTSE